MRRSVILLMLGTSALGLGQPALARESVAPATDVGPVDFAPYQAYPVEGVGIHGRRHRGFHRGRPGRMLR